MKTSFLVLFVSLISLSGWAQGFQLHIKAADRDQTRIIDSLGYKSRHQKLEQLQQEINHCSQSLSSLGYINNQILENKKENDSVFTATISLGFPVKTIHIYICVKNQPELFNILYNSQQNKDFAIKQKTITNSIAGAKTPQEKIADTLTLPYRETENFLRQCSQNLETNGYAFAKIKLSNIRIKQQRMYADLLLESSQKRMVNAIAIKQVETQQKALLPKGALKQIERKYKNRIFNEKTIGELHEDIEKFDFISQVKYPEILFTKDSTKAFVYIDKRKANRFDGFLGFSNTEGKKIKFSGYLDLSLVNALRSGESMSIYWKSNEGNQKIFNANLSAPYLFKGPMGIKAQINIFKQDSTFQNTKTLLQLSYSLDPCKRVYLGYEATESSDIQNSNNSFLQDYNTRFFILTADYKINNSKNNLFPIKSYAFLQLGTGQRQNPSIENTASTSQQNVQLSLMNDFYLGDKNIISLKNQNYYLNSKNYLTNELYRFGGINSIRGFAENSLQASQMTALMSEYRYIATSSLFFHTILDYCYYKDPTLASSGAKGQNLLGLGFGLGVQTQNGFLRFSISNGRSKSEQINFSNNILSTNYTLKF